MKILIVEDNRNLAKSIERVFKQENFSVRSFWNGKEAEEFWISHHQEIDLVILDIQLPKKNGFEICQTIRKKEICTPVIMLTAKQELEDRVYGLEIGADDYLGKPFQFEELLARVHALLRRPRTLKTEKIQLTKNIVFDGIARKVEKNGTKIALTPKEFEILEFLVRHKNEAVSQQKIFDHCFDFAKDNWSNAIEVHVKNLRKKLFTHNDEKILKTVRGFGYRLEI
ncbi:response regulator transcription factor [Candidatus Peregrinibacteria bacterium]|nr:MAG: response regulator transcription factor [Candidatus Peregrinibacteria bacterium]